MAAILYRKYVQLKKTASLDDYCQMIDENPPMSCFGFLPVERQNMPVFQRPLGNPYSRGGNHCYSDSTFL